MGAPAYRFAAPFAPSFGAAAVAESMLATLAAKAPPPGRCDGCGARQWIEAKAQGDAVHCRLVCAYCGGAR